MTASKQRSTALATAACAIAASKLAAAGGGWKINVCPHEEHVVGVVQSAGEIVRCRPDWCRTAVKDKKLTAVAGDYKGAGFEKGCYVKIFTALHVGADDRAPEEQKLMKEECEANPWNVTAVVPEGAAEVKGANLRNGNVDAEAEKPGGTNDRSQGTYDGRRAVAAPPKEGDVSVKECVGYGTVTSMVSKWTKLQIALMTWQGGLSVTDVPLYDTTGRQIVFTNASAKEDLEKNGLTEGEKAVLNDKYTERAGESSYSNFYPADGYFACRKCLRPIYSAAAKFNSGCGWPAFDKCYKDAIKMVTDDDGYRMEIICNKCGGHLGHVFTGEARKDGRNTNERHCANGRALKFIKDKVPDGYDAEEEILTQKGKAEEAKPKECKKKSSGLKFLVKK